MSPLSLNNNTVNELISLCLKGDRNSSKILFDQYSRKMMALCYRFARDRNEAEDILQEGFVRVFAKLDLYSGEGSFEAWMRRVIINTALKYRQKHITRHNFSDLDHVHVFDNAPTVLDSMSQEEILNLVQELPSGYKTVFNLYVIEGYSHKEIAESMGIGESTSRSQLVKARAMLKEKLLNIRRLAG